MMLKIKREKTPKKTNRFLKKNTTSTKAILVLVFFCVLAFTHNKALYAYNIQPAVADFIIRVDDSEQLSSVFFTNTTEQEQNFKVYSSRYNPEKEEILDERDFVFLETNLISLAPDETAEIGYNIQLNDDVLGGSYFSIIVVENVQEDEDEKTSPIGINYGIGSLVAIHVVDDIDIFEIFTKEVDISLSNKKPLNPFNTSIEYKIKNNSKYTFLPSGQITIGSVGEKPNFHNINIQEKMLYPTNEMTFEFEYEGDIKDFLQNKTVRAITGMQFSSELRENTIELPFLKQTFSYILGVFTFVVITTIVLVLIKMHKDKDLTKKFREKLKK